MHLPAHTAIPVQQERILSIVLWFMLHKSYYKCNQRNVSNAQSKKIIISVKLTVLAKGTLQLFQYNKRCIGP